MNVCSLLEAKMRLRIKILLVTACAALASPLNGASQEPEADLSNGFARHITVGEQRKKASPPSWQVFDWLFGWSKPKTGRNAARAKGRCFS